MNKQFPAVPNSSPGRSQRFQRTVPRFPYRGPGTAYVGADDPVESAGTVREDGGDPRKSRRQQARDERLAAVRAARAALRFMLPDVEDRA